MSNTHQWISTMTYLPEPSDNMESILFCADGGLYLGYFNGSVFVCPHAGNGKSLAFDPIDEVYFWMPITHPFEGVE